MTFSFTNNVLALSPVTTKRFVKNAGYVLVTRMYLSIPLLVLLMLIFCICICILRQSHKMVFYFITMREPETKS